MKLTIEMTHGGFIVTTKEGKLDDEQKRVYTIPEQLLTFVESWIKYGKQNKLKEPS